MFFRNEPTPQFSEVPAFSPRSSWKPPKGHPNLEVFLGQLENEIFKMPFDNLKHSNNFTIVTTLVTTAQSNYCTTS